MKTKGRLKARELRQLPMQKLQEMLSEIDRELMKFRAAQHMEGGMAMMAGLPTGPNGGTNYGLFQTLKKNKAIILTVMTENRGKVMGLKP